MSEEPPCKRLKEDTFEDYFLPCLGELEMLKGRDLFYQFLLRERIEAVTDWAEGVQVSEYVNCFMQECLDSGMGLRSGHSKTFAPTESRGTLCTSTADWPRAGSGQKHEGHGGDDVMARTRNKSSTNSSQPGLTAMQTGCNWCVANPKNLPWKGDSLVQQQVEG
eukprot:gene11207-471_t